MSKNKALKEAYKLKKFKMGVFQIRNTLNNKIYIDSSVNLESIWNRHRTQLKFNNHHNPALQFDWNTYGESCFVFEIISELKDTESKEINYQREVKTLENLFMEELQPYGDKGYHEIPKKRDT